MQSTMLVKNRYWIAKIVLHVIFVPKSRKNFTKCIRKRDCFPRHFETCCNVNYGCSGTKRTITCDRLLNGDGVIRCYSGNLVIKMSSCPFLMHLQYEWFHVECVIACCDTASEQNCTAKFQLIGVS
jgi:hypothetical protein